jgi:hypothetical protein
MSGMDFRKPFNLFVAVVVTAGLTIAPVVAPATGQHPSTAEMVQTADTPDMMADMPCCPDKKSNDCQDCPLIAICMLKLLQASPSKQAVVLHLSAHQRPQAADDRLVDGLGEHPPDHPPRTIV